MAHDSTLTSVKDDRSCVHCGYSLRGLPLDGNCPECGKAVRHSLRGDLLNCADPDWLERLRFGVALKLWNILLLTTARMAGLALVIALNLSPRVLTILMAAAGAFGLWASFVITTQEPRLAMREDPVNWRKTIRTCATIAFVATIATEAGRGVATITMTCSVLSLTSVVALFGELVYFRRFALRIPNDKLARHTRIVMWGTVIVRGLLVLTGIATAFAVWRAGGVAFVAAFGVLAIPVVVFSIWYIVLLFRYRSEFATAAAESRGQSFAERQPDEQLHGADPMD